MSAPPDGLLTYGDEQKERVGFFTDTSICIGCKACEVACKEWNLIPEDGRAFTGMSYDNTVQLDANSWRHVAFIEQDKPLHSRLETPADEPPATGQEGRQSPEAPDGDGDGTTGLRWLMESDVCKHCTHAACLDVCPTGSLFRTEFGTVVVQQDICNGCGYCVPACPFGVLDKRHLAPAPDLPAFAKEDGRVWKCTLCYDRLKGGHEPACAKACPTKSIQFGPLDELRERADARLEKLQAENWNGAQLYGRDSDDGVGGFGAFFLLLDKPEVYGLPPDPVATTRDLPEMWRSMLGAAAAMFVGIAAAALIGGRK
jgi:formate dehydrogenase iron-sulfur subunit